MSSLPFGTTQKSRHLKKNHVCKKPKSLSHPELHFTDEKMEERGKQSKVRSVSESFNSGASRAL